MSQLVLILDPLLLLKQYYDRNFILCINQINVGTISYIENLQRCVMYISLCNLIFIYCLHKARVMGICISSKGNTDAKRRKFVSMETFVHFIIK